VTHSTNSATDAAGGYVTDIPYLFRYHRELNPAIHALMIAGEGRTPAFQPHGALTYLELGCGFGLSTLVHAAGNPAGRYIGVDFMPQHIATAKGLAAAAGVTNVEFIEMSFADLAQRPLPDCDVIAAQGVWSWVDAANRDLIIRFVDKKLKPGGVFYVSYNALPALAPIMPAREIMWSAYRNTAGPTSVKIDAALARVREVMAANSTYLTANPRAVQMLERALQSSPSYLAHEYFNATWDAFYHADVANSLRAAGMSYLASAHILSNMDPANLTPAADQLLAKIADRTERETLRDYFLVPEFRRDIFVRNLAPAANMDAALHAMKFAGLANPTDVDAISEVTLLGQIKPPRVIAEAILRALMRGPASANDLATTSECRDIGRAELFDVLLVLTAMGAAEPAAPEATLAARKAIADRLNPVLWNYAIHGDTISVNLSPVTGGGIAVPQVDQLFLLARYRGEDPVAFLQKTFGANVEGDLAAGYTHFLGYRLPLLQRLGIA
jgi:SAM-dependent methyltransferase